MYTICGIFTTIVLQYIVYSNHLKSQLKCDIQGEGEGGVDITCFQTYMLCYLEALPTFFCLKISWNLIFLVNGSVNELRMAKGGGYLEYKKKIFEFFKLYKKWEQSCNNLQSRDPALHFSYLNCAMFVTIFIEFWNIYIFF